MEEEHATHKKEHHISNKEKQSSWMIWMIAFAAVLILFNQWQLAQVSAITEPTVKTTQKSTSKASGTIAEDSMDLSGVTDEKVMEIQNTAQAINLLFPIDQIETSEDAIAVMIPKGTPFYGEELGISYDDPITALNFLARELYPRVNKEVKENNPEIWERYINLAAAPRGISCEFCCGVGPQGITKDGRSRCGCTHNPAVLALTLYLMNYYPDMSDAEILKEVLKWKSLWFPKNMVGLAMQLSGGDTSALDNVPGMVGGC